MGKDAGLQRMGRIGAELLPGAIDPPDISDPLPLKPGHEL